MRESTYRTMWPTLVVLAAFCVPVIAWLSIPTYLFIADPQTAINGRTVEFYRRLPFGDVTARWRSEIFVHNESNLECRSGDWSVSQYQETRGNFVTYDLGDWALPCIEAGASYSITTTRQVLLFGVFPLRPSIFGDTIEQSGDKQ